MNRIKSISSLILTFTLQPPVRMVDVNDKVMFWTWMPSREVWLAVIDKGVADTSCNRNHYIILDI